MMDKENFEVQFKNGISGSLTLTIKRKNEKPNVASTASASSDYNTSDDEYIENLPSKTELDKKSSSITSFYDRPDESYESLILMAFHDVSEEQRREGLQAHDIAQWMCRKFPYFATIKSLLQCITYRLASSSLFKKQKKGKKILWSCSQDWQDTFTKIKGERRATVHDTMKNHEIRQARIRKRPNFFSIDWKLKNKKKKTLPALSLSLNSLPRPSPKRELVNDETEYMTSHLKFLKNTEAIVQPCSPEKSLPSAKLSRSKKTFTNLKQKSLLSYLGLMPAWSTALPQEPEERRSGEDQRKRLSCSSLCQDSHKTTRATRSHSFPSVSQLRPPAIDDRMFANSVVSPPRKKRSSVSSYCSSSSNSSTPDKPPSPAASTNTEFSDSAYFTKQLHISCDVVKIERDPDVCMFNDIKQSTERTEKIGKVLPRKQNFSQRNARKTKTSRGRSLFRPIADSSAFRHNDAELTKKQSKTNIVPGNNGSPLFPTIQSIFSIKNDYTQQPKNSPVPLANPLLNGYAFSNYTSSPWNGFHSSNSYAQDNLLPNPPPLQESVRFGAIGATVPPTHGFASPPANFSASQQRQCVSLDSFAQPTWTRDVMQSVMTTSLPNYCFIYPVQVMREA